MGKLISLWFLSLAVWLFLPTLAYLRSPEPYKTIIILFSILALFCLSSLSFNRSLRKRAHKKIMSRAGSIEVGNLVFKSDKKKQKYEIHFSLHSHGKSLAHRLEIRAVLWQLMDQGAFIEATTIEATGIDILNHMLRQGSYNYAFKPRKKIWVAPITWLSIVCATKAATKKWKLNWPVYYRLVALESLDK